MRDLIDGTRPSTAAPSLDELRRRREEILAVCARNGASGVRVFGSVARGDQDENSDVDLLIDMETGRSIWDLTGVVLELEELLGCPVNIVEASTLNEDGFSRRVREDAVPL